MPRNIELKARLTSRAEAEPIARSLATQDLGEERQVDTYFHCAQGRLKLREIEGRSSELIAYQRGDGIETRVSDYAIVRVDKPDMLKQLLAGAIGIRVVVKKLRHIWLHHKVRMHLDDVEGLGCFLEFEAVLSPGDDEASAHRLVERLAARFGVTAHDRVALSYGELLLEKDGQFAKPRI